MATLTKKFIETQKQKLESEKLKVENNIVELKQDDPFSDPGYVSDNAAVDTDVREQESHQTIEAEIKDLQDRLNDININLKKLQKGQYGYCESCNKLIPLPRLELIPEARLCVDCEKRIEN